jgi:hypothetical protein
MSSSLVPDSSQRVTRGSIAARTLIIQGYDYWPLIQCLFDVKLAREKDRKSVMVSCKAHDVVKKTLYSWIKRVFDPFSELLTVGDVTEDGQKELLAELITTYRGDGQHKYLTALQEAHLLSSVDDATARGASLASYQVRWRARALKEMLTGQEQSPPGIAWLHGFWKRHPDRVELQNIKRTTKSARVVAEAKTDDIRGWYKNLKVQADAFNIHHPSQVIAFDETGIKSRSQQQNTTLFVVSKGYKNIKRIDNRPNSFHTSVMHICDASGHTYPSMVKIEGQRILRVSLDNAPAGTSIQSQKSGYFVQDDQVDFAWKLVDDVLSRPLAKDLPDQVPRFRVSFPRQVYTVDSKPVFLEVSGVVIDRIVIGDGCASHLNSSAAAQIAEAFHLHFIYLLANLTHRMQLADIYFFDAFKNRWYAKLRSLDEQGIELNKSNILDYVFECWQKSQDKERIKKGFRELGQWPVDESGDCVVNKLPAMLPRASLPAAEDTKLQLLSIGERLALEMRAKQSAQRKVAELEASNKSYIAELDRLRALVPTDDVHLDASASEVVVEDESNNTSNEQLNQQQRDATSPAFYNAVLAQHQVQKPVRASIMNPPASAPPTKVDRSFLSAKRLPVPSTFVTKEHLQQSNEEFKELSLVMRSYQDAQQERVGVETYTQLMNVVVRKEELKLAKSKKLSKGAKEKAAIETTEAEAPKKKKAKRSAARAESGSDDSESSSGSESASDSDEEPVLKEKKRTKTNSKPKASESRISSVVPSEEQGDNSE